MLVCISLCLLALQGPGSVGAVVFYEPLGNTSGYTHGRALIGANRSMGPSEALPGVVMEGAQFSITCTEATPSAEAPSNGSMGLPEHAQQTVGSEVTFKAVVGASEIENLAYEGLPVKLAEKFWFTVYAHTYTTSQGHHVGCAHGPPSSVRASVDELMLPLCLDAGLTGHTVLSAQQCISNKEHTSYSMTRIAPKYCSSKAVHTVCSDFYGPFEFVGYRIDQAQAHGHAQISYITVWPFDMGEFRGNPNCSGLYTYMIPLLTRDYTRVIAE